MILPLVLALVSSAFAQTPPAEGGKLGVIVRLEPTGQELSSNPTVTLQPGSGDPIQLVLTDDGQPPDVSASDGRYAGVAMSDAMAFDVTMTLDGKTLDGGSVEWSDGGAARDLVLTLVDNTLTSSASSPEQNIPPSANNPTQGGTSPAEVMGSPTGMTSAATIPSATTPGGPALAGGKSTASDDGWLWIALGTGALGLVGGLLVMLRGGSRRSISDQLERAPTPPIFGPGTPSLSSGLHIWTAPREHHPRFLQHLVGSIAQNHRVLLVLPDDAPAPAVHGGPVYVTRTTSIDTVDALLADLETQPGAPIAMVILDPEPDPDRITEYAELMDPDPGAILLCVEAPPELKAPVRVEVDDGRATLRTWEDSITLVERDYRYERVYS